MIINPVVILGVIFTILRWTAYVLALSKSDLSYTYPIWSSTFVIVPLLSLYIFKENISPLKINGLTFIAPGIFLVAVSVK
jgi:multidrug transporter EmrE-like cation transporter